jgi:hypothetical protein
MASDANSLWVHLVQDTAGIGNLAPPTPFPSDTSHSAQLPIFCPQDLCKMEKTAPPMQTTYQFIMIKHSHFGRNQGTAASHQQRHTILCHQSIASISILVEIARELTKTSNQARALPHTTQNSPQSYIASSEVITAPPPSTNNTERSLTTRLLPSLQFLRKSLENSQRHIQSSSSPPQHLPKYTSIKHQNFGINYGNAAIHRQRQTIPHHQAIANTPIIKRIACELAKIHPIKREPSPTPPKKHLD